MKDSEMSIEEVTRGSGMMSAAGRTLSQPLMGRVLTTHEDKLKTRLSCHAFAIADATQTGMEDEALYKSTLGRLWIYAFGKTEIMHIVLPIFLEPTFKKRARKWAMIYIGVTIMSSLLQVWSTNVNLAVTSSVEYMDSESFYYYLVVWFAVQAAMLMRAAIQAQARWELRMMIQWRLQFRMGHALFSGNAFHHLQVGMFKIDSTMEQPNPAPESLLCRDSFLWLHEYTGAVDSLVSEAIAVVTSIYTVSKWSYVVTIYMMITVPIRTALTMKFMPRALHYLHSRMLATNWDLMFVMGRIMDNSEQIALLRGGQAELWRFTSVLKILFKNHVEVIGWSQLHQLCISLMGTAFMFPIMVKLLYEVCDHGLSVSAAMTYSGQVFMVGMHLGIVSSASQLFIRYQQTVANMNQLIRAGMHIASESDKRAELGAKPDLFSDKQILVGQRDPLDMESPVLEMRNVTVWAPKAGGGHGVFFGFNMKLMPGQSMLIVGDTGVGKSALLRAIHGLWWCGRGRVERCHNSQLSCMPERPFTYKGTLRQNLLYPEVEDSDGITDELIMETLELLNLGAIATAAGGLDHKAPWHSILSLGQQQRLGFARILLRPHIRLVLLDEATSALDMQNERKIYQLLKERFPSHISVGHRPSVREYHTHVAMLHFKPDRSMCTSQVEFLPIGNVDWDKVDTSSHKIKGNAEEKLWAQHSLKQAGKSLEEADKAEYHKSPKDEDDRCKTKEELEQEIIRHKPPKLISLERHWGGASLLIRALRDIIWPMLTQTEVFFPILFIFGTSYVFSYMSLSADVWFGYPYAQVISVLQTRNSRLCWTFFFRVIIFYYPFSVFFFAAARVFQALQGVVCRVVIKWYLSKAYLNPKTDAFYHMNVARIMDGNPGTRISTWDADTANMYITTLVSTFSSAVFGVFISCRSLYQMDTVAFAYFVFYIAGGAVFYMVTGYQVFIRYITWLDITMKLHGKVLHVREHSESIALLQGADMEKRFGLEMMDQAITPGSKYLWLKDASNFLGDTYFSNVSEIMLTLLTGPMVLMGDTTYFGQTQMKGIIGAGAGGVKSMLVEMLFNVEGQAAMERLWELLATILHIEGATKGKSRFGGDLGLEQDSSMSNALEIRNVSLRTPVSASGAGNAMLLVQDVSLSIAYGESLLIAGESGIGKSSMLRAVAGLWRHGTGTIRVSNDSKSFFIPQRPYIFVGNLRENLLYPDVQRRDIDDDTLAYVARAVGLEHLLISPGLGEDRRWIEARGDVNTEKDKSWPLRLSLGHMQRLNFGRLLLKEDIRLVFLDEATSALGIESEEAMYKLLKENVGSYISVAHRPQLRRFHERAFVMLNDHTKPRNAPCKTKCLLMSMAEYERELAELSKVADAKAGQKK